MARRRLPSRSTNSSAEFIACMNEIKSKNIEEISRELNRLYPGRQNQDIRERKKDVWDQIISAADSIITLADFIPSIQNWKRETRDIIEEYQMIASSQNLNDLKIFHSSLLTFFRKLQREQGKTIDLIYFY